ncbi:5'-3' exonuclease [Bacillus stratosphericus]|uniref:5'-3' exonuclease n=1 Tax=Bacillus stratosphericus TaxID=293386 RepID=UPI001CFAACD1|nr:5'-3' exonuclease [Bacillus stratosphericus]
MKKHVLLVDGMALLFRSFYATAVHRNFMINDRGVPTNGVNGYMKHLLTAVQTFEPTHIVCCWDMGSQTYRNELFQAYKANLGDPPFELIPQFDLAKEATEELGIVNVGLKGFEADDCIGTLAALYQKEARVTVLTGDKDLLQILNEHVTVALMQKGIGNYKQYTKALFEEEMGISPKALIDMKALMGDSGDNYPGVKGIGEKTALKFIQTYQTIDRLLENVHELTATQQKKMQAGLEDLKISRILAEIKCDVPLSCPIDETKMNINPERAASMLRLHQIKGIEPMVKRISEIEIS